MIEKEIVKEKDFCVELNMIAAKTSVVVDQIAERIDPDLDNRYVFQGWHGILKDVINDINTIHNAWYGSED